MTADEFKHAVEIASEVITDDKILGLFVRNMLAVSKQDVAREETKTTPMYTGYRYGIPM